MSWASSAPGAITALVQCLRAAPELQGVAVYDGPTVDESKPLEAVTVAGSGEDATAADGQMARDGLSAARSQEQYTIQCSAAVLNGSNDMVAARTRAFELVAAVGAALAADPRLGGAVMSAQIGPWTLTSEQISSGALCSLAFGVAIEAFTPR